MCLYAVALHCLLFQVTEYDIHLSIPNIATASAVAQKQIVDSSSTIPTLGSGITDLDKHFQEDLTGGKVTALADGTVSLYGSSTLKHVNDALNFWLTTWHMRRYRESAYENRTFLSDPLPFFWLAKLYLVLHCYAFWIRDESDFAISRVKGADDGSKWTVQIKILGWLAKFRRQRCRPVDIRAGNYLYKILERSDN